MMLHNMNPKRRYELEEIPEAKLTDEEMDGGWHFCPDWDGMMVGPTMIEFDCCCCELPRYRNRS